MNLFAKAKSFKARLSRKLVYLPSRSKPLQQSVLFESFSGKQVGDSPLDIAFELQKTHPELSLIWTITPGQNQAPSGMVGLKQGSARWLKALARSKYLVNNANFPSYFRKRDGQIYLQTWHGTPLKMIGKDIRNNRTSKVYQDTMIRESGYWDYLISPNAYCSAIFPKAFTTGARLLELGYPRNDRLRGFSHDQRQEIRQSLGVSDPSQTLVLYAPTWRDAERGSKGGWEAVDYLNENSQLPTGYTLLYRGHANTHASHKKRAADNVIDVTLYPDVANLFIAADVLVTDYSSVMFDFSVTGKPIIFLTPDIESYERDRGFYFDFRSEAPGPILLSAPEVLEALTKLPKLSKDYAEKYRAWRDKFNPKDDGNATARVIKAVWK
jgi:CDP-glycerol glycerophosphotransferase